MLQLSQNFSNRPVISLRTGGRIGKILGMVINPANLQIEGFYCQNEIDIKKTYILLTQDIRDIVSQGVVVDDHDAFVEPNELVRLKHLLDLQFSVIGKPVYTESHNRLGKVNDVAIDTDTMMIQRLYVGQSVFKSIAGGTLNIDRSQIVGVSDTRITVQDLTQKVPAAIGMAA